MSTKKFTVPNWSQSILAKAVGLDPKNVSVEHENEQCIVFLQYMPHRTVTVGKIDGTVNRTEDKNGNQ